MAGEPIAHSLGQQVPWQADPWRSRNYYPLGSRLCASRKF